MSGYYSLRGKAVDLFDGVNPFWNNAFLLWLWKKKKKKKRVFEVKHFCTASDIFRFVIDSLACEPLLGQGGEWETVKSGLMHFHLHLKKEERRDSLRIKEEIIWICTSTDVYVARTRWDENVISPPCWSSAGLSALNTLSTGFAAGCPDIGVLLLNATFGCITITYY